MRSVLRLHPESSRKTACSLGRWPCHALPQTRPSRARLAIARGVRTEGLVLIALDLDLANIQAYPPSTHSGAIVQRLKRQDKRAVLGLVLRIISALKTRLPAGDLWIVEPDRIRFPTR